MDFQALIDKGIDVETGINYAGGEINYLSVIQRLYRVYDKNLKKINDALKAEDYSNYAVYVHALKSNARMIGAMVLGASAEAMELAGKKKDIEAIESGHEVMLKDYAELIEVIKPYGEMERVKMDGEITEDEAREIGNNLLEALEEFDDDKAIKLADDLMNYPFRITQKRRIKEAKENIEEFMYDEAMEIIKEVIAQIEE